MFFAGAAQPQRSSDCSIDDATAAAATSALVLPLPLPLLLCRGAWAEAC